MKEFFSDLLKLSLIILMMSFVWLAISFLAGGKKETPINNNVSGYDPLLEPMID